MQQSIIEFDPIEVASSFGLEMLEATVSLFWRPERKSRLNLSSKATSTSPTDSNNFGFILGHMVHLWQSEMLQQRQNSCRYISKSGTRDFVSCSENPHIFPPNPLCKVENILITIFMKYTYQLLYVIVLWKVSVRQQ